jgi:hypothetical protein
MEIVVGGHFFRREANQRFFQSLKNYPAEIPESEGVIFHYEMRDCSSALLRKWRNLAERHRVSGVQLEGGWSEKEKWLGKLWAQYEDKEEELFAHFARGRRTHWETETPSDCLRHREELSQALVSIGVITPLPVT